MNIRATLAVLSFAAALLLSQRAEARYFLPREGRFLSPDRAGMVDGPNLYQYARSNPVMFTDPTGKYIAELDARLDESFHFLKRLPTGGSEVRALEQSPRPVRIRVSSNLGISASGDQRAGDTGVLDCGGVDIYVYVDVSLIAMTYPQGPLYPTTSVLGHELVHARQIAELGIKDGIHHSDQMTWFQEYEADLYQELFLSEMGF